MNSIFFDKNFLDESLLRKTFIEKIYLFDEINSTNEFAKNINENNILILSEDQLSGKGRFGKTWYTEKHNNLTFTIRTEIIDVIPAVINYITSLNTLYTLEKHAGKIAENVIHEYVIKWPNDIILNKRKVSGILIEKKKNIYLIGVGINLNQLKFDKSINNTATSLLREYKKKFDKNIILVDYIKNFDKYLKSLKSINSNLIFKKWLKKSYLINKRVKYNNKEGIVKDFTLDGGIIINSGGQTNTFYSSDISLEVI